MYSLRFTFLNNTPQYLGINGRTEWAVSKIVRTFLTFFKFNETRLFTFSMLLHTFSRTTRTVVTCGRTRRGIPGSSGPDGRRRTRGKAVWFRPDGAFQAPSRGWRGEWCRRRCYSLGRCTAAGEVGEADAPRRGVQGPPARRTCTTAAQFPRDCELNLSIHFNLLIHVITLIPLFPVYFLTYCDGCH